MDFCFCGAMYIQLIMISGEIIVHFVIVFNEILTEHKKDHDI